MAHIKHSGMVWDPVRAAKPAPQGGKKTLSGKVDVSSMGSGLRKPLYPRFSTSKLQCPLVDMPKSPLYLLSQQNYQSISLSLSTIPVRVINYRVMHSQVYVQIN